MSNIDRLRIGARACGRRIAGNNGLLTLFVPVLAGMASGWFAAESMGMTIGGILLYAGWGFVTASLALLGVYRIALVRHEDRLRALGMPGTSQLQLWFKDRETSVDHVGIPLTVAALFYSIGVLIFTLGTLIETAILKTLTLFSIH